MNTRDMTPAQRVQIALDLFDLSLRMLRQRLAREGKSPEEVEAGVAAWLQTRPHAKYGDVDLRPVAWPRR